MTKRRMSGAALRRGRCLRGITQRRLAEILGCHESTIWRSEARPRITRFVARLLAAHPAGRFWRGVSRGAYEAKKANRRERVRSA